MNNPVGLIPCYCGNTAPLWHQCDNYQEISCDVCDRSTGKVYYQDCDNVEKEMVQRWNRWEVPLPIREVYNRLKDNLCDDGYPSIRNPFILMDLWNSVMLSIYPQTKNINISK